MRVLFADKLAPLAAARLRAAGHDVREEAGADGEALVAVLREAQPDALVVRSTKVTAAHLEASSALSIVVRAGAGVNTIDLEAAGQLGVFVTNCPGKNAVAVAELVFGLMLAIDRHLADNVIDARAGVWNKGRYSAADGLKGKRLGILGMGDIGREVARRARAFDMDVTAWSRSLTPEGAAALGVRHAATPREVAARSDVLTVHVALTADTRNLVDADLLGALPERAIVLNTSRAEVLDEAALLAAMETRGLRAGLDVFQGEPSGKAGAFDAPLARHPNVVLTHHIGASTQEAQDAVAAEVVRILLAYDVSGRAPNCVNLERHSRASHLLVVRHRDRVGVLAGVLDRLRESDLNVAEMENTLFAGGQAAVARIQVHGDPSSLLEDLSGQPHVLHVAAMPLDRRA